MKSSSGIVRGSAPGPSYFVSGATTDRRPKRRASMKRSSLPLLRVRMAWLCGGIGVSGVETIRRPVMPRWTRNCAGFFLRLRSTTMVLPTRWTRSMRLPVRVSMISSGGDLKVWGLLLVQTERMVWPWMRAWTPLATVSTSGSSGMLFKYRWPGALPERGVVGERNVERNGSARGYTCRPMKKTAILCVLAGCSVMCGVAVFAFGQNHGEKTAGPLLLVANQGDRNLSLIDPGAGKQVATVPVDGVTGHEVVASPDGKTAYVPIYGDSGVGRPGTDGAKISVIDLASRKVVHTIDFGHGVRPHCAIYDRNSGMLYVTTELDKTVSIIDPKTLKIVGSVPTGQEQSHMLVLSRDGSKGYTANVGPGTVSVLDMKGRKTLAIIPVSKNTQRISISRDDSMVFTADQTKPQLAVIDTATNKVKTWVPLPAVAYGTAATLDGRWLLVTLRTGKQVAVVDLKTMKVAQTIDVADGPTEILMSPDGKTAFVSCTRSNQIAAIDLAQWKVARLIDAGKAADGLAWAK